MIRIRRIYSTALPSERELIEQVKDIFRRSFSAVADYAEKIPLLLDQPFRFGYRAILLVALSGTRRVTGFALILHFPEINSSLLDFLAANPDTRGGGVGGALYEAIHELLRSIGSRGLYLEALPDDPRRVTDPVLLKENRRRMKFYEIHGARPIEGTDYEAPFGGDSAPPLLLFDGLGRSEPLGRAEARAAIRLILVRKYRDLVTPDYVERVVESVVDDPVRIRPPRYLKVEPVQPPAAGLLPKPMTLVISEQHRIHHVHERGYVERPARVEALQEALHSTGLFGEAAPRHFGEEAIREVHDPDFVRYLKAVCEKLHPRRPVYPYVFPIRRPESKPRELTVLAGYYCIDTFTPLDRNAYRAARAAVDVALTGAELLLEGQPVVYALCRPPGHHAERRVFGGFCYFNNAAVAAHRLSRVGKVAILDIDFHHGNGTQNIFWARGDVLTLSIHGHPTYAYPYFSGFADEIGESFGRGFNRNFPLPEKAGWKEYRKAFERCLELVSGYKPTFLIVGLGYDTMKGDPTGSFGLGGSDFEEMGARIASLGLPTLVVQEGGYSLRNLRRGAVAFFQGISRLLATRDRAS